MSSLTRFLSGKVFLVTGGTGFVARGLVEKLLRHAPDLKRIYLLIRPRRQPNGQYVSAQERLENEVIKSNLFRNLRGKWREKFESMMRRKVAAVDFDLTQDRLGIDPACYARLTQEVDVVISSAASVIFDEPLDLALKVNTLGPRRVLELAKACRDAIFVHVSTAYVNGQQTGLIPEAVIPPDRTVAQLIGNGDAREYDLDLEIESILSFREQVEEASRRPELRAEFLQEIKKRNRGRKRSANRLEHELEVLRKRWIRKRMVEEGMARGKQLGWHDSYTLTKAMGEQSIVRSRGTLPTAIVRPSIIESSLLDPEPGWLNGLKVADPLISHFSKGRLPDFPADPDIVIDLTPVDIVFNAIIAVLPTVRAAKDLKVYHVATGSQNPLKVREMFDLIYEHFRQYPMRDRDGKPIAVHRWHFPSPEKFRRYCRYRYQIPLKTLFWCMDHLPIIPWSPRFRRRASMLEATLERVFSLAEIYSPYTNLNCEFETENTRRLYREMEPEDREIFNFDVSRIQWREYIQDIHLPGLKRHVLKKSDGF